MPDLTLVELERLYTQQVQLNGKNAALEILKANPNTNVLKAFIDKQETLLKQTIENAQQNKNNDQNKNQNQQKMNIALQRAVLNYLIAGLSILETQQAQASNAPRPRPEGHGDEEEDEKEEEAFDKSNEMSDLRNDLQEDAEFANMVNGIGSSVNPNPLSQQFQQTINQNAGFQNPSIEYTYATMVKQLVEKIVEDAEKQNPGGLAKVGSLLNLGNNATSSGNEENSQGPDKSKRPSPFAPPRPDDIFTGRG